VTEDLADFFYKAKVEAAGNRKRDAILRSFDCNATIDTTNLKAISALGIVPNSI
jgi:hypothetical protein